MEGPYSIWHDLEPGEFHAIEKPGWRARYRDAMKRSMALIATVAAVLVPISALPADAAVKKKTTVLIGSYQPDQGATSKLFTLT